MRQRLFIIALFAALAAPGRSAEAMDVESALRSLDSPATTRPSKAWIDNLADYVRDHPGRWIVGRSQQPCLSEAEAEQAARADAAHLLSSINSDTQYFRRQLAAEIAAGHLQVDQLIQRFDRPYGTVWTASVLIDASQQKLDNLLARYQAQRRERQIRMMIARAGAAAVILLAWVLYLVLNSLTSGYFTTRLRLIAAVVCVAAIIASV